MIRCNDSVTSRRSHYIRSIERSHYERTLIRFLRHFLNEKKNGFGGENISVVRRNVFERVGLVLLSFELKDLVLRLGQ